MGYWKAGADGSSLHLEETGLVWGDQPADVMDKAIKDIVDIFRRDWHRSPTVAEIKSGLLFSLGGQDLGQDDPRIRHGLFDIELYRDEEEL